jgi:GR25 family glycosyltransferase involved in LPS biosynthesis
MSQVSSRRVFQYDFFKNVERIGAIKNSNGAIGCGMSHIKVLTKLLDYNDDYFMVCEDDLCILNDNNYNKFIEDFDKIKNNDWDIVVITPRGDKMQDIDLNENNFYRINNNQTTTAYIIKKTFICTLIANLKESITGLLKGGQPNVYAIDQWWKKLQNEYKFYYYKDIYAGQLVGYSDIEMRNVNYNQRYILHISLLSHSHSELGDDVDVIGVFVDVGVRILLIGWGG